MKTKAFIISFNLLIFLAVSCKEKSGNKAEETATTPSTTTTDTTITATGDNSANAIDWMGTYQGVLPCADCEGIETSITLGSDRSYTRTQKYLGKGTQSKEQKGTFSWDASGGTIVLSGINSGPNQYLVGENQLIQLDMNGKRITGNLAEKYYLKKSN